MGLAWMRFPATDGAAVRVQSWTAVLDMACLALVSFGGYLPL
jgi:hypothetical protein